MSGSRSPRRGLTALVAALLVAGLASGCEDEAGPLDVSGPASASLSTGELAAVLDTAMQDEYRAELTYRAVLLDLGRVRPFTEIAIAEQRQAAAVAGLFGRRALPVPASRWSLDDVLRYSSENLRSASLNAHLPAFRRCAT